MKWQEKDADRHTLNAAYLHRLFSQIKIKNQEKHDNMYIIHLIL